METNLQKSKNAYYQSHINVIITFKPYNDIYIRLLAVLNKSTKRNYLDII